MEEKMLLEKKYNIIQRIQKRLLIRKLNKHKDFELWRKSSLKYDSEIMAIAWEIASNEQYKEFPIGMQIEMGETNQTIIEYLSLQAQTKIFERSPSYGIDFLSDEALKIVIKNNPDNWSILSCKTKDRLIKQQENFIKEIISKLRDGSQREIVSKKPYMILYCSKETKKQILKFKNLSSPEWQAILSQEENLSLPKLMKYISYTQDSFSDESNQKVIAQYCNSIQDKEEIIEYLREMNKNNDEFFTRLHISKLFDIETEMTLFDELVEMYHREGRFSKHKIFRLQCMHEKLLNKKNGVFLYSEYKDILDGISDGSYDDFIAYRVFDLLFREKTILEKVSPTKVINYIKLLDEYEKTKMAIPKGLVDKSPTSQKIYQRRLHKQFTEIIEDAFGKKAAKIIADRPGIRLQDIENTEVFSPNIVENFRPGFVHDLLSYNIVGLDAFIKLAEKPEDIKAFKLYYDIMSKKIGENVVTMQMCISNYSKFQDVLREASRVSLSEEQITQIENLCSWPTNICNICAIKELDSLEDRLIKKVTKEKGNQDIQQLNEDIRGIIIEGINEEVTNYISNYNIMRQNIHAEETLFDYKNLSIEEYNTLTEEERTTFNFLQQKQSIDINSIEILREAYKKGIPLSSIFINQYSSRIKIKKEAMERFNGEITNREKIEQALEEGKDEVRIINIDGVELIDLGSMEANFICHNPNMNNSNVHSEVTQKDSYMLYDGLTGISTISSYYGGAPDGEYVYWDFNDNEIISIKTTVYKDGHVETDAGISHGKKLVVSSGFSNRKIKDFLKYGDLSGEIAFYRRKRNHNKEEGMYAGKITPNAILGINEEKIIASQIRFGKKIPIIVNRNDLSAPEVIKRYQEMIKNAKEKIQQMQAEKKEVTEVRD